MRFSAFIPISPNRDKLNRVMTRKQNAQVLFPEMYPHTCIGANILTAGKHSAFLLTYFYASCYRVHLTFSC